MKWVILSQKDGKEVKRIVEADLCINEGGTLTFQDRATMYQPKLILNKGWYYEVRPAEKDEEPGFVLTEIPHEHPNQATTP